MLKIDLHTHSLGSSDGGLTATDYRNMLESKRLDYIAITDHGSVETALSIKQQLGILGDKIIIGEEIKTLDGELVGLYLTKTIPEKMSLADTVAAIRAQNGIVYVPHPFESMRSGVSQTGLLSIVDKVDIIEVCNGRAYFQNKGKQAMKFAQKHQKAMSASSDAHGYFGWGATATIVDKIPTRENLTEILKDAILQTKRVGFGILYPKYNRLKEKFFI